MHLEVDAYLDTQDVDDFLHSCFGAIRYDGGENPEQVIDPLYFITDKGTYDSGDSVNNSSCTNLHHDNYAYSIYKGASINGKEFNYIVRTDIYLRGFNKTNAADYDAIDCLTAQPTDPCNR